MNRMFSYELDGPAFPISEGTSTPTSHQSAFRVYKPKVCTNGSLKKGSMIMRTYYGSRSE